jgi:hypothetical protein
LSSTVTFVVGPLKARPTNAFFRAVQRRTTTLATDSPAFGSTFSPPTPFWLPLPSKVLSSTVTSEAWMMARPVR